MAKNARGKARNNTSAPSLGWLDNNPDELPRADVALKDKADKRAKLYRIGIYSILFVGFPLSAFANLATLPKLLNPPVAAAAPQSQLTSETKSKAMLAVRDWLGQSPSPLPGGTLLSWDGVDIQAKPELITNPDNNQVTEKQGLQLHHLTVAAATGQVFDTTVQVAYSPFRGVQAIGMPTLIPRAPDEKAAFPNLKSWPDLKPVNASESVTQAISAWVKAYTSGDPNALRLAVHDQAENRSYVPLKGATASDIQVSDVAAGRNEKIDASDSSAKPGTVIARVTFSVQWEGHPLERGQIPSQVSYDVLVQDADKAAPAVVAWGGVGTGPDLTAFMNAIENRKISSDNVDKSVPTQSAKPAAPTPEASTAAPAAVAPAPAATQGTGTTVNTAAPEQPSAGK